ncbi:uncharacterized protein LOC128127396 [Lactuca sativa]|uniref:uncharacterized protein LOC128127396 n=1 Tax=Lactuca sativa TaxID=4236 RepID=UPI0022AFE516|nr:uncharacterized protein LOC128127396 [Lactuca sativa]
MALWWPTPIKQKGKQQKEILVPQKEPADPGFHQEATSSGGSCCQHPRRSNMLRQYAGNLPKCNKCNFHHAGSCREMHCSNCNKKGHTARFCWVPAQQATPDANVGASRACYGCGETENYKRDYLKARNANAGGVGRVLVLGNRETMEDPMVVIDTYIIEMENGKAKRTNNIYTRCTLTLDNHSCKINLMLVSIKSFDVIIGMDWLSYNRADILFYERVVRLNLSSGKTLIIYGEKPSPNLQIISCVKAKSIPARNTMPSYIM